MEKKSQSIKNVTKVKQSLFDISAEKFVDMILALMTGLWLTFWMYESFILFIVSSNFSAKFK